MKFYLIKCVFLYIIIFPIFSQTSIYEQRPLTLQPSWRQALGGVVTSLPHVQAQSVVVALDGGNIRAYSTAGTSLWNYSARGRISPFVTRSREGTAYISRANGILIAVNRTGRELWRNNLGSPLCAMVVTGWDGRLFVPTDKKITCLTASGNILWSRTFESPFSLDPKLDQNGGIILALENNEVYRIDPFGNANMWALSGAPSFLLSFKSASVQQQIMVIYADGIMQILDSTEEWFISAQGEDNRSVLPRLPANPLAVSSRENNIAALLNDGRVILVSLDEKKIIWTGYSHLREIINNGNSPDLEAKVLFDERGIYILSRDGATGFSHEGRRLWFKFLQNAAVIPAFGDDGVLYSGGKDWILYAYKIEDRELSQRDDIFGPAAEGSYGLVRPQSVFLPDIPFLEEEIRNRLQHIDTAINMGRVGANEPAWVSFLMTLSANHQDYVLVKIEALNLLGKIGSRETIPWLIEIINRENEPTVKAAAIKTIGNIGVDPSGIAVRTFVYLIVQGVSIREEQVLVAIASATGALCRFSGPPLSQTGIRILNMLSAGNQHPAVRRQAERELASLR